VKKGISLEVLPKLTSPFDCILIDGDHNWYTVYHELNVIREKNLLRTGGLIFFHDVDWPWARRDMYYQPDTIPTQYQQEWAKLGVVRGNCELSDNGSFGGYRKAVREGGPRNGVLTAIDDFLLENPGKFRFFRVRAGSGLGTLLYRHGFRDDISFLALVCKRISCSIAYHLVHATRSLLR